MEKIIVYYSKTGFSKQYAQWLSEDLGIEVYSVKEVRKKQLDNAKQIIFISSLFASMIKKLNVIKKYEKKLKVIAVGYSQEEGQNQDSNRDYATTIKEINKLSCDVYYLRGGVCFEKLGFISRMIFSKVTGEKESKSYLDIEKLREIENNL